MPWLAQTVRANCACRPILRKAAEPFCIDEHSAGAFCALTRDIGARAACRYLYRSRVAYRSARAVYREDNISPGSTDHDQADTAPIILPRLASVHLYWPDEARISVGLAFPFV
ncbi:hypothetical protein EMPG_09689 [Blastomyces silverae]|uniref:Leucine-rich repeat domain-containing protein n=1 Tax=Blastomyces silverae TaxID=2060906 RepID=A0A0H1BIR0_9EURO|nr:hypothetical protein EMPG_09689 [Blastomyces silverae]